MTNETFIKLSKAELAVAAKLRDAVTTGNQYVAFRAAAEDAGWVGVDNTGKALHADRINAAFQDSDKSLRSRFVKASICPAVGFADTLSEMFRTAERERAGVKGTNSANIADKALTNLNRDKRWDKAHALATVKAVAVEAVAAARTRTEPERGLAADLDRMVKSLRKVQAASQPHDALNAAIAALTALAASEPPVALPKGKPAPAAVADAVSQQVEALTNTDTLAELMSSMSPDAMKAFAAFAQLAMRK